jgi:hypothetical protein
MEIIVVKNKNDKIVGIFPFTFQKKPGSFKSHLKEYSLKDSYLIGFYTFLIDNMENSKIIFQQVVKYFKINKKKWDIIKFFNISEEETAFKDLILTFFQNFRCLKTNSKTLVINCNRDFDDYITNEMKGKERRELRRKIRRINERGDVRFIEIKNKKEIKSGLEKFYDIEDDNWKGKQGTSLKRSYYGEFYKNLAYNLFEEKKFSLYFLQLNNEYIAGVYAINDKSICYLIKIGYDEKYSSYSPSNILFYQLFKFLFSQRIFHKIDFYGPYSQYQKVFGENTRTKNNIIIFNNKIICNIYYSTILIINTIKDNKYLNNLFPNFKNNEIFKNFIDWFYR